MILNTSPSRDIAIADINLDGFKDIFYLDESLQGYSLFLQPFEVNSLAVNMSKKLHRYSATEAVNTETQVADAIISIGTFDINSDGYEDVLLGRQGDSTLMMLAGMPELQEIPVYSVELMISADLTEDGTPELYLYTSAGLYAYSLASGAELIIEKLALMDIESNGDLLAILSRTGEIAILGFENGLYEFGLVIVANNVSQYAFIDIDSDGDLDLVILNSDIGSIELRYRQAADQFGEQLSDLQLNLLSSPTTAYVESSYTVSIELENLQGVASEVVLTFNNSESVSKVLVAGEICELTANTECLITQLATNNKLNVEVTYQALTLGEIVNEVSVGQSGNEVSLDNNVLVSMTEVIEDKSPEPKSSSGGRNSIILFILLLFVVNRYRYSGLA